MLPRRCWYTCLYLPALPLSNYLGLDCLRLAHAGAGLVGLLLDPSNLLACLAGYCSDGTSRLTLYG